VTKLHQPASKSNGISSSESLQIEVNEIVQFIQTAVDKRLAAHEVEEGIWRRVLQIGRKSLGMFFDLHGDGDEGTQVTLAEGHTVKSLSNPHRRSYLSIFGEFEFWRIVYGTREGQEIEYIPLDARLQLPRNKFSYLLQDWDQSITLEMPFNQVSTTIEKILGLRQSVHSLERCGRHLAEEVPNFWEEQSTPPAEEEGALLVCTADGKGVPMHQHAEQACIDDVKLDKGMRPGSKKMALIGSVYTIEVYLRTPDEVLDALFRNPASSMSVPP